MVAGVHFLPDAVAWRDVGWKALAVNISDIAAMGGTPAFALVTLNLPPETPIASVDELYEGLRECAAAYGVTIAGGDIVAAPAFSITIALTGDAEIAPDGAPLLLRRDAARAGDLIAVSGPLGESAGGLRLLLSARPPSSEQERCLIRRHMRPIPRLEVGRAAIAAGVRCAIDISDGMAQDLGHVCVASGLGAEVSLAVVPIDSGLAATFPGDAALMAVTGGEDYELLLTGSTDAIARTSAALETPLTVIGRMVAGAPRVRVLDASGGEVALPASGWDHLSRRPPS